VGLKQDPFSSESARNCAKLTALRALGGSTMRPGSKRQFENASLYIRNLGNEQAERFGRGSSYLFNDWAERFGPLKDCQARVRRQTIKKTRSDARRPTSTTLARLTRLNSFHIISRRLICQAKTPHLSTI
jgi:hypothetical protein